MSPTKQAKSKATVARNQNSIWWLDGEKKTLGEPRLSRGPVLLWPTYILFQSSFTDSVRKGPSW